MTRAAALLKKMTLEEKLGQLNLVSYAKIDTGTARSEDVEGKIAAGLTGGIFGTYDIAQVKKLQTLAVKKSRLGIPLLFGLDVIHGHRTIFPIPLALACSWNLDLIKQSARIAACEATTEGINWVFSPMVDICRDPRWGRCSEGAGEDVYLGSAIAKAMVHGLQGDDLSRDDTVMACVKHLGLYGAAEAGRDYNTVDMSELRMHEDYLPPYKAAIDAGVGSVMTAFNDINGTPASAHKEIFQDLLRGKWGFDGVVVTDYTAINEMTAHGLGDLKTVAALALDAGVDMDMVGEGYLLTLANSLTEGRISLQQINTACLRILEAKDKLGLFDDPYRYINPAKMKKNLLTKENRQFARKAVAESCVLLKNDNNILPLKKNSKIALIGPLADDRRNMLGNWSVAGKWIKSVSIRRGIENVAGGECAVRYARGSNITDDPDLLIRINTKIRRVFNDPRSAQAMISEAVAVAGKSDVIVAVVGEAQEMSGENASRADIAIPEHQRRLLQALKATGKPLVLVTISGRPLTLQWESRNADAILHIWFGGTETGNGVADVLFGEANPSAKLTMNFPRHIGQAPLYYNHKITGRPIRPGREFQRYKSCYIDVPNTPLYPFGFGLSYTQFKYGPVKVSNDRLCGEFEVLKVSAAVKNTGNRTGQEIVQLYITDPVASVTRPVKSLRGFEKIELAAGETKRVVFTITAEDLKFYNAALLHDWEPGEFVIHIGPNSRDTRKAKVIWNRQDQHEFLAPAPGSLSPDTIELVRDK